MTTYTRRIASHRAEGAFTGPIWTNPGTHVVIVRDIIIENLHSGPQLLGVFVSSGTRNLWLFRKLACPAGETQHLEMRQELLAGDVLQMSTDLGGATLLVTGYLLNAA